MAVGALALFTIRSVQSSSGYSIVNVFVKGLYVKALLEVHYIQIDLATYPTRILFFALIYQGSAELVTMISLPVKDAPHVSPYEQLKVQPAMTDFVKKLSKV